MINILVPFFISYAWPPGYILFIKYMHTDNTKSAMPVMDSVISVYNSVVFIDTGDI